MIPKFIFISSVALALVACDRQSARIEAQRAAELEAQRSQERAANEKIKQLEDRLNEADRLKAAEREAELARVKDELAQVKKEKEEAAERARQLEAGANPTAPPEPPRETRETREPVALRADERRVIEEEEGADEPVYTGRVVPETVRVSSVQSFYEPLDPYGDWIETDDYGYVFRPQVTVTRSDWRPYTDGRWVHTDYGWTWQSNEDFGWATYHYGRWARVGGVGWVWVPGREWAPAWVSWRRGPNHCGWAPLPPESRTRLTFTATVDRDYDLGPAAYVFVALANFGVRSYAPIIEPPRENVKIINKTVNITNVTYNTTNNHTVVYNGGPNVAVLRARSKQPIEQATIDFAQPATGPKPAKLEATQKGKVLQVSAPAVAQGAPAAPKKVKEKLAKTNVEKGWEGVDRAQVEKVRQEIAQTSTERKKKPAAGAPTPPAEPQRPKLAEPEKPQRPIATDTPQPPKPPTIAAPEIPKPDKPAVAAPELPKPEKPHTPVVETPKPLREPSAEPAKPRPETPKIAEPPKPEKPEKPAVSAPEPLNEKPERPHAASPELPKMPRVDAPQSAPGKIRPEPPLPKVGPPNPNQREPVDVTPDNPKPGRVRAVARPSEEKLQPAKPPKLERPAPQQPSPEPPRPPKIERTQRDAEAPAPHKKKPEPQAAIEIPKAPKPRPQPQEIPQPRPQPQRAAAPDGERAREKAIRQASQAAERPQRPQQPQPVQQPPPAGDQAEKKKKKDKEKDEN